MLQMILFYFFQKNELLRKNVQMFWEFHRSVRKAGKTPGAGQLLSQRRDFISSHHLATGTSECPLCSSICTHLKWEWQQASVILLCINIMRGTRFKKYTLTHQMQRLSNFYGYDSSLVCWISLQQAKAFSGFTTTVAEEWKPLIASILLEESPIF